MRPRKTILLVCPPGMHADTLRFVLETRGRYRVTVIHDPEDALWLLRSKPFDLLLAELAGSSCAANELARQAKQFRRDLPAVLFSRTSNSFERASHADCFIPEQFCTSEEILTRVGIAVCRKRGPKKHEAPQVAIGVSA